MNHARHDHQRDIVDQFTRQAEAFADKHRSHAGVLALTVETAGVNASDTALDVACGPGLVACAFAHVAAHVTGVDITPAMLARARRLQAEQGLTNMAWHRADAESLPFDDGAFTLVVTRYSLHHFLDPAAVLAEMRRACAPGGKVVVIDATPAPDKAGGYNAFEKLRDPSHARAMPLDELLDLMRQSGLTITGTRSYWWEVELEAQLRASAPHPGDEDRLRRMAHDDLDRDQLGMNVHRRGDAVIIGYPTMIAVAKKP